MFSCSVFPLLSVLAEVLLKLILVYEFAWQKMEIHDIICIKRKVLVAWVDLWAGTTMYNVLSCYEIKLALQANWNLSLYECLIFLVPSSSEWCMCACEGRREVLWSLLICTFYLALFKPESSVTTTIAGLLLCSEDKQSVHVTVHTDLLPLLTFLFTIIGIKTSLPELCTVYILILETRWLEANPDLDALSGYSRDSSEILTGYMGWRSDSYS